MANTLYGRWGFLAAAFLLVGFSVAASANDITGLRIADREGYTRMVMDGAAKIDYEMKNLADPPELIVTIKNSRINGDLTEEKYKSWLVKEVRGAGKGNATAFYVKLNSAVRFKAVFQIPPKEGEKIHRLVIDVIPSDGGVYKSGTGEEIKFNGFGNNAKAKTIPAPKKEEQKEKAKEKEKSPAAAAEQPQNKIDNLGIPLSMQHKKPEAAHDKEAIQIPEAVNRIPVFNGETPLPAFRPSKPVIVIDPGHGGNDPGAIAEDGAFEKNITLQYAKTLKDTLAKTGKYKVYLTRDRDEYVGLKERTLKAREVKADLLISLHADMHQDSSIRGLSVYTLSPTALEKQMAKISRRIDKSGKLSKIDLSKENKDTAEILLDLVSAENRNSSAKFAELLVKELGSKAKLLEKSHRFAGYMVLTGIDVPSVLIELGYLSNTYEKKMLMQPSYRQKLTGALARAVDKYFNN